MTLLQPKPYMDNLPFRRKAMYKEKRLNTSKLILENGTPLPKTVTYEDIDASFYKWVDKTLEIVYDGKRLPTYKLFSNQRINEYSQTWSNKDESGNIILNFKTITRENNPKRGQIYGGLGAVPGNREYTMFTVPVLQENGTEAYDHYSMKLPTMVDFKYIVSIVTNKYELLNRMNEMMQFQFKSIDCYLYPNEHPMSMTLDDVGDESEYSIDDRKYYSQTYHITLRGYIILEDYFKVTRIPSRFNIRTHHGNHYRKGHNPNVNEKYKLETMRTTIDIDGNPISMDEYVKNKVSSKSYELETLPIGTSCNIKQNSGSMDKNFVNFEEEEIPIGCCEQDEVNNLYNKVLKLFIHFTDCDKEISFVIDTDFAIETFEIKNIYDFKILVNNELIDVDNIEQIYSGDTITIRISKDDDFSSSEMTIIGYDPNIILNKLDNPESELDTYVSEEHIEVIK